MGAVDTTYTFTATDTITSAKMNNIIDQTTITTDAIIGTTLDVASGKLKIRSSGITSNEMGSSSVTTSAIADGAVIPAKLSAGGPSWDGDGGTLTLSSRAIELGNGITSDAASYIDFHSSFPIIDNDARIIRESGANATLTISNIGTGAIVMSASSGVTFGTANMPNPVGTAPIFGVRAWVAYDPDTPISPEFSGTYSRIGTTVTVTAPGHGLKAGSLVYLNFTSGAATDGEFVITGVSTTTVANDTFTITHGASGNTSGNVGIPRATITGSGNVSSVTLIAEGRQVINFTTEMPNTSYAAVGSPSDFASTANNAACDIMAKYIGGCQIRMQAGGGADFSHPANVMVIG